MAVVANDGDTNNEGRSATDNDVEIGDGRLRLLPWYGKHHPARRVHLSSSAHTSNYRVEFAVTSPADVFREPHPVTGEHANGADASPRLFSNRSKARLQLVRQSMAATKHGSGKRWLRHRHCPRAAATRGCDTSMLYSHAPQAFSTQ